MNTILSSLIAKAKSRGLSPDRESIDDEEVRRRAEHEYDTLADELVGELPNFEIAYEKVAYFYRSLPW
jgi:hypothetical protein